MKQFFKIAYLVLVLSGFTYTLSAQTPIIQTMYTADPAPLVYNDTVFLYVGHDEDNAPNNSFLMREYSLFTTTDMVNWTAQKTPLKTSDFEWSAGDASAAQCVERNGKFYFYISTLNRNSPGVSVGVAVADSPFGPFKDAIGEALITNDMTKFAKHSWDDLDPSVMIDSNGQAYLYWGNNACYWVKLNEDMISIDGEISALDIFDESVFGPDFEEAPWAYERKGIYYMIYASNVVESIHYTTSKSPEGPWEYGGGIMPHSGNSGSNHPAIIDFKEKSYFFYHGADLPGGGDFKRSVCIEEFVYNEDGSIPEIPKAQGVFESAGSINPFIRNEAETIAESKGVKLGENHEIGVFVKEIHNKDYIKVSSVDFGKSKNLTFKSSVSSRYFGGKITLKLDSYNGEVVGVLNIPYLGDWDDWRTLVTNVEAIDGIHDLFMVFEGNEPHELFRMDFWQFENIID
ncbi:glycoside hydrolase family 43 protein [Belliella calami]|nr:glycoside hydrolase family 43 protein [Belliella calami]